MTKGWLYWDGRVGRAVLAWVERGMHEENNVLRSQQNSHQLQMGLFKRIHHIGLNRWVPKTLRNQILHARLPLNWVPVHSSHMKQGITAL